MDIGKVTEKTRSFSKLLFFIPFTIILFVFAVFLSPFITKDFVETEGTVKKVESDVVYDADNNATTHYYTDITYTVDGVEYNVNFDYVDEKAVGSKVPVYYNPKNPNNTSNSKNNAWLWLIFLGLGILSAGYTVFSAITDRNRGKQTDELRAKRDEVERRAAEMKKAMGDGYVAEELGEGEQTEYYFRFDGHTFKPGYLIEDKNRTPLFEGKMLKNIPFAPREFEFVNHRTHVSTVHKVGHVVTSGTESGGRFSTTEFSKKSWFKFDGVNIWDYLHNNGILIDTDMGERLGSFEYTFTKNGRFFAKALMTSKNVHEEDEENAKINIVNKMFYRIWTNQTDLELVFTAVFAIAETEQAIYS